MGFFSDYKKAKKEAELNFKKNHPFLASLAQENNGSNKNTKKVQRKSNLNREIELYDLTEEEQDAILEDGYEPEDFEDDELEEDDYYYDEKF